MNIAQPSSSARYSVMIVAISCVLLVFLGALFLDRGTTFELKQPIFGAAMTAVAVFGGGSALGHWFMPREDLPRIPDWNLRHDSPGRWALKGAFRALVITGLSCALVYMLLNVLAQHLPGRITKKAARLETLRRGGTRDRCAVYAEFSREVASRLRSCVVPTWGTPLLSEEVRIGTAVQLQIKENAIGWVLVSITLSGGATPLGSRTGERLDDAGRLGN